MVTSDSLFCYAVLVFEPVYISFNRLEFLIQLFGPTFEMFLYPVLQTVLMAPLEPLSSIVASL